MSGGAVIFLLSIAVVLLTLIVLYQRFTFQRGIQGKLEEISRSLARILETESDEKVMIFTDNKRLMDLLGQINLLLQDRQKMAANFRRSQNTSKKMLSNISHDIKTPLTVIVGYLQIMRLHSPGDETLIKVERKANQVMELINQFFTLAKLEAGDTDLSLSKLNLNELCREAVLDFYDILTQDEFLVEVQIPEETLYAQGNPEAVNRILFNLISNAVRYGGEGKYLGVALHAGGGMVYVDVIDHGKGIEKYLAANVFERLYTMEDSRNRNIQGNGLGLTIAKNLALQMGGDVYLESVPGRKTVFTLKLKQLSR